MGQQTKIGRTELLGNELGSDNVWPVNFADSEVGDFLNDSEAGVPAGTATVTASTLPVQAQKLCAICAKPLTRRQQIACSRRCSSRRNAAITHAAYPQRGPGNFNFKEWRSKSPVVYTRAFKLANPDKARAHRVLAAAIRAGHLTRPSCCESCLRSCRPDAHHWDYALPLSVRWLCRKCHSAADRLRQRALKAGAAGAQQADGYAHVAGQGGQV